MRYSKAFFVSIALFSLAFSAVFSLLITQPITIYNHVITSSVGLRFQGQQIATPLRRMQPYTYINIPRTSIFSEDIQVSAPMEHPGEQQENHTEELPSQNENNQDNKKENKEENSDQSFSPQGLPVITLDMSEKQSKTNLACKNESKYSFDINNVISKEYPIKATKQASTNSNEPVVLIIHTHGTECYLPDGESTYTEDTLTRTTDLQKNIVSVGKVLAEELNNRGVSTLHCEQMFDSESYSESYSLSEKAIVEYLKKYPSIKYIFDVHRDSIIRSNGEKIKPTTTINGEQHAQAMFVVGTDSKGANHPNWMSNLTVASAFQYALVSKYETLMRPVNVRSASFNAEHSIGSVLIEIGTCGNTLTEAKNTAKLLGQTIAEVILNDGI